MKTEEEKIKPTSDSIFENGKYKLVVGCMTYEYGLKFLHYYINGKPYKCHIEDFDRMITSFLNK